MTRKEIQFERWIARERVKVWEIYRREGAEAAAEYLYRSVKPYLKRIERRLLW